MNFKSAKSPLPVGSDEAPGVRQAERPRRGCSKVMALGVVGSKTRSGGVAGDPLPVGMVWMEVLSRVGQDSSESWRDILNVKGVGALGLLLVTPSPFC